MPISVASTYEAGFSAPGNSVAVNSVDYLDAISDSSNSKYISLTGSAIQDENAIFVFGLQTVVDPGVDTGFTFRVVARYVTDPGDSAINSFSAQLESPLGTGAVLGNLNNPTFESATFVTLSIPVDIADVQTWRADGGFGPPVIGVSGLFLNQILFGLLAGAPNTILDISYIELEYPSAGPAPDLEITSDAGLVFGGGLGDAELVSDAGLIFDFSASLIEFNEYISDAGFIFGGGGLASGLAFTSDVGLVFDFSIIDPVISKDPSGIYTFVTGQHFDRILSRNTAANETLDVEIPEPFGKTGYYGG